MNVLVLGGTGFTGSFLVSRLFDSGHSVTVVTRGREKLPAIERSGAKGILGDLEDPESLLSEPARIKGHDVVLSVANPMEFGRVSRKKLQKLRVRASRFVETILRIGEIANCPLIVTQGTGFQTKGDEIADESWPLAFTGVVAAASEASALIDTAVTRGSHSVIRMLPAAIYGPGGLFGDLMYTMMKKGRYRIIGKGDNYTPRVHVEDLVEAYIRVLAHMPMGERFILADDGPCTQAQFAAFMAECMGLPTPKRIPAFIPRLFMGKPLIDTVTSNCRVCNEKAKRQLGWKLKYPTYKQGLPKTIQDLERR